MAWKKAKKKAPILSKKEQEYVKMKLEEDRKKFYRPVKGKITYRRIGSSQECIEVGRYSTEDGLNKRANEIIDAMNSMKNGKTWKIVSVEVLSKTTLDENDEENNNDV